MKIRKDLSLEENGGNEDPKGPFTGGNEDPKGPFTVALHNNTAPIQ